jgi:predicted nucleotidyltransferase
LTVPILGHIIPDMGTRNLVRGSAAVRRVTVADALFSKSQQRVLAILFGNPHRSFYANEIIDLANVGTGAVQRELGRLEGAELVTVNRVGKQKHYQANASAAVFEPLRELILKTSGLANVLLAAVAPVATEIHAAFVYGSIAKGEDSATSDVDLMVISESLAYADLFALLEDATGQLGRDINPTVYSSAELATRIRQKNSFVTRVMAQPKIWLIGGEDDLSAR